MSSNLTWFYSPGYSYKSYIVSVVFTSPDIKTENVLLTGKTCVAVHASADILLQLLNSLTIQKKWKDISSNAACAFYTKHKDKFASPKQKQPTFLVKINTAWGKGLLGSRRQTLDACNFPAVVVHQCF